MKTYNIFAAFLLIFSVSVLKAQSDYETTQNFKSQWKDIRESIRTAKSETECMTIQNKIEGLRNNYEYSKGLLDKALYPETFDSSLNQLSNDLSARRDDFAEISQLSTRVASMESELKTLSDRNEILLKQIDELNKISSKNVSEIIKLNDLVLKLKNNLKQRDQLVQNLVDGVLSEFNKSSQDLNSAEKMSLVGKIKKSGLFFNVRNSVESNIQFIKATNMTSFDFSEMKREYDEFRRIWGQIGPKLAAVYLNNKKANGEIKLIDSMFVSWNNEMTSKILSNINQLFLEKGVHLNGFNNGEQLTQSILSYMNAEISSVGRTNSRDAENIFSKFTNDIYFKSVKPNWFPLLIKNNIIKQTDQDSIENNIVRWQSQISPSYTNVFYYVAGALFAGLLLFFLFRSRIRIA